MPIGVIVLDDDPDLRDSLVDVYSLAGCACFAAASYAELTALPQEALAARLAILDINLGAEAPSGLDAFRWLREKGFGGAIVFLTGHARSERLVDEATRLNSVRLLQKPMSIQALLELLESRVKT
jgi:FixJ family two-component response regulator